MGSDGGGPVGEASVLVVVQKVDVIQTGLATGPLHTNVLVVIWFAAHVVGAGFGGSGGRSVVIGGCSGSSGSQ